MNKRIAKGIAKELTADLLPEDVSYVSDSDLDPLIDDLLADASVGDLDDDQTDIVRDCLRSRLLSMSKPIGVTGDEGIFITNS